MPSLAKIVGLILAVASPVCLAAQTTYPGGRPPDQSGSPATGYANPVNQAGGFMVRDAVGLVPGRSAVGPAGFGASPVAGGPVSVAGEAATASGEIDGGVSLSPRGSRAAIPLSSPGGSDPKEKQRDGRVSAVITAASSLALVLGIFLLVASGMRRLAPPGSGVLPTEAFEVLGRAPVASRQQVHLLRCGNKLILVSVTPAGAETLTEIADPIEVDRLAGLCRQAQPNSATAAFREVFGQFAAEGRRRGLFGRRNRDEFADSQFADSEFRRADGGVSAIPNGLEDRNA
jgi:flagellar biogenesis protein FliO